MSTMLLLAQLLALNTIPTTPVAHELMPDPATPVLLLAVAGTATSGPLFRAAEQPAAFVPAGPLLIPAQPTASEELPDPFSDDPLLASGIRNVSMSLAAPAAGYAPAAASTSDDDGFKMSYTFIELTYFSTDLEVVDNQSNAWGARGQLGLFGFLYLLLEYAKETVGTPMGDIDSETASVGVGGHWDLTRDFNLVGEVAWAYDDLSTLTETSSGWTALLGARWLVWPMKRGGLELNGGYRYIDRDALFSNTSNSSSSGISAGEIGARFHFLNAFSVGLEYVVMEKDSRYGLDARFSF